MCQTKTHVSGLYCNSAIFPYLFRIPDYIIPSRNGVRIAARTSFLALASSVLHSVATHYCTILGDRNLFTPLFE